MAYDIALETRRMDAVQDNSIMLAIEDARGNAYIVEIVDRSILDDDEIDLIEDGTYHGAVYGNAYLGGSTYLDSIMYKANATLIEVLRDMGLPADARIVGAIPEDVVPDEWETCDDDPAHIDALNDAVRAWAD